MEEDKKPAWLDTYKKFNVWHNSFKSPRYCDESFLFNVIGFIVFGPIVLLLIFFIAIFCIFLAWLIQQIGGLLW